MNYIDIDLFGGIVSNADPKDIREDISQKNINFDISKVGILKANDEYAIKFSSDEVVYDSLFYWVDFSNGDFQKIIWLRDNNGLYLSGSNYAFDYFQFRDVTDSSNNQLKLGEVVASTSIHKSHHHFNSDGNIVRIAAHSGTNPVQVQHVNLRDFWGYSQGTGGRWNSLKTATGSSSYVLTSSNSGYFMDIAYPRNNYIKGVFKRSEFASDIDEDFEVKIDSTSAKERGLERTDQSTTFKVADGAMAGNIAYDSATVNTSFYTHEYALALVYDGVQVGPLGNSTFTRLKTVKSQARSRPRAMAAKVSFEYNIATNDGNSSTIRSATYNPRVTGFNLYRSNSADNFLRTREKSALRRVGTYRIDRSESDMNRVSLNANQIKPLTYDEFVTLDSSRYSSTISSITSAYFKYYHDSTGDSELEEFSLGITSHDDTYGIYEVDVDTGANFVPDYYGSWAITQNSAAIGSGAGTIYNSGVKAIGGEMWILVPGNKTDGDGFYKNCIIQKQADATVIDCIVESYLHRHVNASGTSYYYHACRLTGDSLWASYKLSAGPADSYIYRTNEPIYWNWRTDNRDDSTNKTTYAEIFIYDVDPVTFEGHPYPNDKINHGYEVSHEFMGRRFVGDVTLNLGDADEEQRKNFVLYSEVGMPDVLPSANFLQITSDLGGRIIGFSDMGGDLLIFTTSSIHSLNMRGSSPDTWVLSTISNKVGCLATDSIIKIKDRIFFASEDSCYYLSAQGQLVPISEPINDMYTDLSITARRKTKTIYNQKKGILYWQFGSSDLVGGTNLVFLLHLLKGDVTWTSRAYGRLLDNMIEDFDNEPVFYNNSEILSNPLAR